MELKVFLLCFAFFVVTVSGASFSKYEEDEPKKYTVEVDDGKKKVDETVEIDTNKETEKFHIPSDGDTSPSAAGDVDVIYDFKRKMVMHKLSKQNVCFLSKSIDSVPKPEDLQTILESEDSQNPSESNTPERSEFVTTGTLTDRSDLSDEMAELCKKLTIYIVKEKSGLEDEEQQTHLQRKKRGYCRYRYYYVCYWWRYCRWYLFWWCYYG